jgi:trehalose 2-sulfotransferase
MKPKFSESEPRNVSHDAKSPHPIQNFMDVRLDFPQSVPLRRAFIVASSYRCGSTFLCSHLWRTGLLGAPAEYLNIAGSRMLRDVMMDRLRANSPEDYFAKLLACRTSRNGVFGMKVHFHHFEAAMSWYPSMLNLLSPVTYIYLNRKDRLSQAVSMTKALQTDVWSSLESDAKRTPQYNEAFIVQCLREIQQQNLSWLQWFETNSVAPFVVYYEDVVADTASVVRKIIDLLGAANEEPDRTHVPFIEKLGDEVNVEWRERFERSAPDWESWFPLADA